MVYGFILFLILGSLKENTLVLFRMIWSSPHYGQSGFKTYVLRIKYSQLPSFSSVYFFTHETDIYIECLLCASSQGYNNEKTQENFLLSWSFRSGRAERHSTSKMMM